MRKKLLLVVLFGMLLSACGGIAAPVPQVPTATQVPTVPAANTPLPPPQPTNTPQPAPQPTNTLRPAATPTQALAGPNVQTWVSGLDTPSAIDFAPDGRVFITERPGRIRIIKNGQLQAEPWMTLDVSEVREA